MGYILRRLFYVVPIAIGVSIIVFSLIYLTPGDPISAIVPPGAPQSVVDQLRHYYGFDRPVLIQYLRWLGHALSGDFGTSIATGRPVVEEVGTALSHTAILAISACLLAFSLAVVLGTLAACVPSRGFDRLITGIAVTGVSIPHYWLAIVLVILFSIELPLLPPMGMGTPGWSLDWAHFQHMILPTIALSVIPLGILTRTVRATLLETLGQEFVPSLQANGLLDAQIMRHVFKNAAPNVLAVMGLQAGNLIGGSILIETVFSWPGTGFLLNNSIFKRDLPVLQGTTLTLAMFFVALNFLVDIAQMTIDPRVSRR
jgi:peptide/nickel transport system permease protein